MGVANPQFWGRGGRRGSGMVPFERALVSFYRTSIVTFPLSLRVSEILPPLFSSMPLFPYTTPLVSPKFPHVPPGIGGLSFGYEERRCWASCPCNFFPRFPTCVITIHQRFRQMDIRTTCDRKTALCFKVHCAVKRGGGGGRGRGEEEKEERGAER